MTKAEFYNEFKDQYIAPGEETRQHLGARRLYGLVGPSGSGKTTIMDALGLPKVVGVTDRVQRPGEVHGVDYIFEQDYDKLSRQIRAGEFVQGVFAYGGTFYGTTLASYPEHDVGVMAIQAEALSVFQGLGFETFQFSYIVPQNTKEWFRRWRNRQGTEPDPARLAEAITSFEIALGDPEIIFIMNETVGQAAQDIKDHIQGVYSQDKSLRARMAADKILQDLIAR